MIFSIVLTALAVFIFYALLKGGLSTIARGRRYKSGTGWCFWRWTDVDSEYILRLHIVKTPWFAVCLHWIRKPDAEPWLHDHPVSFFSIILRGAYTELRKTGDGAPYHKVNRWFNFVRASRDDRHRIILARSNTLTLCVMGPKTQEWGFYVWTELEPSGWIWWKAYYARLRVGEDMRGRNALRSFESLMSSYYTNENVHRVIGAPDGTEFELEARVIDTQEPAPFNPDAFSDEEPTGRFER